MDKEYLFIAIHSMLIMLICQLILDIIYHELYLDIEYA